jgi:hypothetical protein
MAAADDDHVCQPVYDESSALTAVVHGSPDMSDATRAALAELVEAAKRRFAEDDADGQISARQEAAMERVRERNRRLRGATP